jgi:LPXTG-site transpeptidase (sortase) family protein
MTRQEIIKFVILRTIGNFLVLFALFGFVATFGPALYYELSFRVVQAQGIKYKVASPTGVKERSELGKLVDKNNQVPSRLPTGESKEKILMPKDTDFSIVIPRIGANAEVYPNVDPENEEEFLPILQKGIAHAKGTVFPGMKGNIYMFAHSTDNFWNVGRYNALFYLLKDVQVGDDVDVFFENVRHSYTITESKVVDGEDVSYIKESQNQIEETLILQTCWPPGTTWKRLLLIAKPKS